MPEFIKTMEEYGAGEVIVQSIDRDGCMKGYDINLVRELSRIVSIPITALGGAGGMEDMHRVYKEGFASGLAAGSMFVFQGIHRGVLINYPERAEMQFNFLN